MRQRKQVAAQQPPVRAPPTLPPQQIAAQPEAGLAFLFAAVAVLGAVRVAGSAYYTLITDCDETFNYWEPVHYVLYGSGFQTWEYAPQYAFRSYGYVGIHAFIGLAVGGAWGADKVAVFMRSRAVLALFCALCEAWFCYGVAKRFGGRLGAYVVAALALSAGMLHAGPAFLPSTFTMDLLLLSWGSWLAGGTAGAVWGAASALCLGWPFAVVALVPYGLHLLVRHRFPVLLLHGVASLASVLGACALVDRWFFGRWLCAAWNIVKYNAFGVGGGGQGSDLYGVEPPSFYAANLVLNFNALFVLAALAPAALILLAFRRQGQGPRAAAQLRCAEAEHAAVLLAQLALWFGLMSSRPHKEERFMFVVFPLVAFAAALALREAEVAASLWFLPGLLKVPAATARRVAAAGVVAAFAVVGVASVSRIAAQVRGYAAPFAAYAALSAHLQAEDAGGAFDAGRSRLSLPAGLAAPPAFPLRSAAEHARLRARGRGPRVCVGKEWYRFPASFFLPETTAGGLRGPAELAFLKSGFGGQLPQPYLPGADGTSAERGGFNDGNLEEADRYVAPETCDYVVDLELPTPRETQDWHYEPWFGRPTGDGPAAEEEEAASSAAAACPLRWDRVWTAPFLHAESTPRLARAFLVPGWVGAGAPVFGQYAVLRRVPCSH